MSAQTLQNLLTLTVPFIGIFVAFKFADRLGIKSLLAYFLVRLSILVCMFVFMGGGSIDLTGWYMHARWMVENGCFPGRDFLTPYHLGFNALLYVSVLLWNSPFSIVVMYTIVELLALLLLFANFREMVGVTIAKRVLVLYATSPVCLFCYRSTQDEPILLLSVAAVLWCVRHYGTVMIFVSCFASLFFTKILAPIFLFPLVIAKRWRGVAILLASVCLYWIGALAIGLNPFDVRFGRELGTTAKVADAIIDIKTFGNMWAFAPASFTRIGQLVCLVALAVSSYLCVGGVKISHFVKEMNVRTNCLFLVILIQVFILTYPMSYFMYLLPALPFVYLFCSSFSGKEILVLGAVTVWQWLLVYTPYESSFLRRHSICFAAAYYPLLIGLIVWFSRKYKQSLPLAAEA